MALTPPPPSPLVGTDRILTLRDGRTVVCWEGGDPTGRPVLFHSGTPSGRLQAALGHEAAVRTGVRLVSFNRPGYGASSPLPPGLAQVGLDGLEVMDRYDVGGFAVLGISGGGPYALATGLADPARVTAVGIAAGIGPWTVIDDPDPEDWERPLLERAEAGDVAGATAGYAERAAAEFGWFSTDLSDEELLAGFFGDVPRKAIAWLDDTDRLRWAADSRDALARVDGYVRDNLSWGTTWDLDLERLTVPCHLWYGAEDGMVPPAHGVWLRDHLPDARLEIRSGEGHGDVVFSRMEEVLAALTA